ncbi:MFS general substrate transporter [Thelephora ganbajun]|uniref:MFS general substrate transporter n=1 Tax=Thelephora ganbajun TaxID=370292 RepID=A0ACB6Z447_THEGA|nr:MFS general substrate transporter [Thelephora ganbajun]
MTGPSFIQLDSDHDTGATSLKDTPILGPKWIKLPALTVGFIGLQALWSVEMSYASPYLLSLGLSKPLMAIVFIAGPLSGLIVQPLVGVLADNSKSRFGRRRPFMIGGAIITAVATILFGFTRPVAAIFSKEESGLHRALSTWLAIFAIYVMDFSINAGMCLQAVDRALVVDVLPTGLQPAGNAWAATMLGIGSVSGFFVGNIDLPHLFPRLGGTQIEVLVIFTGFFLLLTHAITAYCVKEVPFTGLDQANSEKKSFRTELRSIWENALTLPKTIKSIFTVQFFASIGWFPVLFYTTVYVGDIYKSGLPSSVDLKSEEVDAEATRLGTRALFWSACISLFSNFALPFLVFQTAKRRTIGDLFQEEGGVLRRIARKFQISLPMLWALSHALFSLCMFSTFFATSTSGATVLISLTGIAWAVAQWAPFSLLGEAIHLESATISYEGDEVIRLADARSGVGSNGYVLANTESDDREVDDEDEEQRLVQSEMNGLSQAQHRAHDLSAKAGVILGLHNICVVIPQMLVTGMSSIIFALFDPDKSAIHRGKAPNAPVPVPPANGTVSAVDTTELFARAEGGAGAPGGSIGLIFKISGIFSTIAFILALRLARDLKRR